MAGRGFFKTNPPSTPAGGTPAEAVEYDAPRAMTAGVEQLDLTKSADRRRTTLAWQEAAWGYAKQIGEIKYAFGLTSNITSRARFYAGVIDNNDEPPVDVESFLKSVETMESEQHASNLLDAAKIADEAIRDLFRGGQARLTRILALNLQVAGEAYLFDNHGIWDVASINEIVWGDPPRLHRSKYGDRRSQPVGKPLKDGAYIARVYREDAQYADDADSNMIGVLDSCEQVVLFDQMMRYITRSRMSAPVWTVPAGTVALNGKDLDVAVRELAQQPIEDEAALYTVVPLLLQLGEDGKKIEQVELGRKVDEAMINLQDNYLQRILDGLDIPKDMVSGMDGVRYSNALAVNDNFYKGHIEPLIVLISDILTYAYLRPLMHKAGVHPDVYERFVIWYNPAAIVTRPDRSSSADTGLQNKSISYAAWRRAHGYSEHDAPTDEEILRRLALERAVIPPDMSPALIEMLAPAFFEAARKSGRDAAAIPDDVAQLLDGATVSGDPAAPADPAAAPTGAPAEAAPAEAAPAETPDDDAARAEEVNKAVNALSDGEGQFIETEGQAESTSGGKVPQGGTMPPRPR